MRPRALATAGLALLACAGCGQNSARSNAPVSTQGASLAQPTQVTESRGSKTPCKSFPPKRPSTSGASSGHLGACSSSDLSAALAIAARFKRTVATRGDVCDLLTPFMRTNAERWAHEPRPADPGPTYPHRRSCSTMAMFEGNATTFNGTNPVGEVLTFPASPHVAFDGQVGPEPRGAIISFASQGRSRGVNIVVLATGSGWLIDQIGYEF